MRRTLSKLSQGAVASRSHNALNKNVFNKRLNCSRLRHCLRFIGSEFHIRCPAAAKHRSPKMLDVRPVTRRHSKLGLQCGWVFGVQPPRAGFGVVRIDPVRFLAGCRTRRRNQALSVLSLSIDF